MKTARNLIVRTLIAFALVALGQVALFATLPSNPAPADPLAGMPSEHASLSTTFPVGQAQFARRTAASARS